eukprot:TRINITY_DN8622_c0_g1_i3.p1 TRINITY_DN8622_c0_g1~~TRINITY_DN8622_c0_g1_i3.p1  ORF type:complete len:1381 (+),score=283.06 TRINITY_DN8622_c0_g1_i3:33-4175(+)
MAPAAGLPSVRDRSPRLNPTPVILFGDRSAPIGLELLKRPKSASRERPSSACRERSTSTGRLTRPSSASRLGRPSSAGSLLTGESVPTLSVPSGLPPFMPGTRSERCASDDIAATASDGDINAAIRRHRSGPWPVFYERHTPVVRQQQAASRDGSVKVPHVLGAKLELLRLEERLEEDWCMVVETCHSCHSHGCSVRHDPEQYASALNVLILAAQRCETDWGIRLVPVQLDTPDLSTRLGACEVFLLPPKYLESSRPAYLLHSKILTKSWPTAESLYAKMQDDMPALDDSWKCLITKAQDNRALLLRRTEDAERMTQTLQQELADKKEIQEELNATKLANQCLEDGLATAETDKCRAEEEAAKIPVLEQQLREAEEKIEQQLREAEEKIAAVAEERAELGKALSHATELSQTLQEELRSYEASSSALQGKLAASEQDVQELTKSLASLEAGKTNLEEELATSKAEAIAAKEEQAKHEARVLELDGTVSSLTASVNAATQSGQQWQDEFNSMREEKLRLEQRIKALGAEKSELQRQLDASHEDADKLKQELENVSEDNYDLRRARDDLNQQMSEDRDKFEEDRDKLEEEKQELEEQMRELESQLEVSRQERKDLDQQLEAMQSAADDVMDKFLAAEAKSSSIAQELDTFKAESEMAAKRLEEKNSVLEAKLHVYKEDYKKLMQENKEASDRSDAALKELVEKQAESDRSRAELQAAAEKLGEKQAESDSLRSELDTTKSRLVELRREQVFEVTTAKEERDEVQEELTELQNMLQQLRARHDNLAAGPSHDLDRRRRRLIEDFFQQLDNAGINGNTPQSASGGRPLSPTIKGEAMEDLQTRSYPPLPEHDYEDDDNDDDGNDDDNDDAEAPSGHSLGSGQHLDERPIEAGPSRLTGPPASLQDQPTAPEKENKKPQPQAQPNAAEMVNDSEMQTNLLKELDSEDGDDADSLTEHPQGSGQHPEDHPVMARVWATGPCLPSEPSMKKTLLQHAGPDTAYTVNFAEMPRTPPTEQDSGDDDVPSVHPQGSGQRFEEYPVEVGLGPTAGLQGQPTGPSASSGASMNERRLQPQVQPNTATETLNYAEVRKSPPKEQDFEDADDADPSVLGQHPEDHGHSTLSSGPCLTSEPSIEKIVRQPQGQPNTAETVNYDEMPQSPPKEPNSEDDDDDDDNDGHDDMSEIQPIPTGQSFGLAAGAPPRQTPEEHPEVSEHPAFTGLPIGLIAGPSEQRSDDADDEMLDVPPTRPPVGLPASPPSHRSDVAVPPPPAGPPVGMPGSSSWHHSERSDMTEPSPVGFHTGRPEQHGEQHPGWGSTLAGAELRAEQSGLAQDASSQGMRLESASNALRAAGASTGFGAQIEWGTLSKVEESASEDSEESSSEEEFA